MSGTRLGRNQRKELTRRLLIDAAAAVFARRGFDAASLDEVAEAAGFTKGAVYSNFRSKTDLIMALIDRHVAEQLNVTTRAMAGATLGDAIGRLEAAAGPRTRSGLDWLQLMYEFWLYARRDERARTALAEQFERARVMLAQAIEEKYADTGTSPPMPVRDLAILIEAIGIGLGFQAALDPGAISPELSWDAARRLLGAAAPVEGGEEMRAREGDDLPTDAGPVPPPDAGPVPPREGDALPTDGAPVPPRDAASAPGGQPPAASAPPPQPPRGVEPTS